MNIIFGELHCSVAAGNQVSASDVNRSKMGKDWYAKSKRVCGG